MIALSIAVGVLVFVAYVFCLYRGFRASDRPSGLAWALGGVVGYFGAAMPIVQWAWLLAH